MNNLKEERVFLINEFSDEDKKRLLEVTDAVGRRLKKFDRKAAFLKKFTINMGKAYYNLYKKPKIVKIEKPKVEIKPEIIIVKPVIKIEPRIEVELDIPPSPVYIEPYKTIISDGVTVRSLFKDGMYSLFEPELNENDKNLILLLKKKLGNNAYKKNNVDENDLRKKLTKYSKKFKIEVNEPYYNKIKYYFSRDVLGYGRIDALLKDTDVKEIICNGINQPVIVTFKNNYDVETDIAYDDEMQLNQVIERFSRLIGRNLNEKNPFLAAELSIGNIQANLKTKLSGAKFAIRKRR